MKARVARSALRVGLLLVFAAVVLRTAWLCDDAYITFRTIDNFNNGYGLRWNVAERVQVFTHPLWMFVLSAVYRYTHEVYFSTVLVSLCASAAAFGVLLFGVARTTSTALIAGSALVLSKSFTEFSTSGLENPLTHLLLASFFAILVRSDPRPPPLGWLALSAGLAASTRMDTLLLYLPVLALVWWRGPRVRGAGALALGFLPFLLWELFALLYYGFPFPNTAYAKLQTGVSRPELIVQGLRYLADSLRVDPLTPLCIVLAAMATLWRRSAAMVAGLAGLLCYLAYTVAVGGDFMSGRFLSPVVFGAALLISRLEPPRIGRAVFAAGAAALLVTGLAAQAYRAWMGERLAVVNAAGIADERRGYDEHLGLLQVLQRDGPPRHPWAQKGLELRASDEPVLQIAGGVGLLGFYAGPLAHVLDVHGVGDPFLARLPAKAGWRIGHFVREPRIDYIDSLRSGTNRIVDPDVARYCDKLFLITRGALFDPQRLGAIVAFNLGLYDHLLDDYLARKAVREEGPRGR